MENGKDNIPDLLQGDEVKPDTDSSWFDSLLKTVSPDERIRRIIVFSISGLALLLTVLIFLISILYFVPEMQDRLSGKRYENTGGTDSIPDPSVKKQLTQVTKEVQKLSKKYNAYTPGLSYIVINTTDNRFSLYQNKKVIREGFCSSGSYTLLQTEGEDQWIFKTPKGMFHIQGKTTNPVWIKPDWAFIELGLPIPPAYDQSRYEYGVLGDYALSLGDGYLIHGTIYKRFLGMPVTHGCVRLNDEDLEAIYNTLNIGSKVYIF
jgi:lipoprotein-anchoring transpeptidase ErfK/SrfK